MLFCRVGQAEPKRSEGVACCETSSATPERAKQHEAKELHAAKPAVRLRSEQKNTKRWPTIVFLFPVPCSLFPQKWWAVAFARAPLAPPYERQKPSSCVFPVARVP